MVEKDNPAVPQKGKNPVPHHLVAAETLSEHQHRTFGWTQQADIIPDQNGSLFHSALRSGRMRRCGAHRELLLSGMDEKPEKKRH